MPEREGRPLMFERIPAADSVGIFTHIHQVTFSFDRNQALLSAFQKTKPTSFTLVHRILLKGRLNEFRSVQSRRDCSSDVEWYFSAQQKVDGALGS